MPTEFELKYRCTPEDQGRIQAVYPGGYRRIAMATTYYDTPTAALSQRHWTLRHRQEGERHVCTLKTPAPGGARGEWELDCPDIHAALPRLAEASGNAELLVLTREGLVEACGAAFQRLAKQIEEPNFTAELAIDRGILTGGGKELPFAEVELELKSGSREALIQFAARFARKFRLEIEPRSKFARAKALAREG